MRWTGWIVAAAIIAGCVGSASGQREVPVVSEESAHGRRTWRRLSGEACCSPPGYSGVTGLPGCCCTGSRPLSAITPGRGYCEHYARVQAFGSHIGIQNRDVSLCPAKVWASAPRCVERSARGRPTDAGPASSPGQSSQQPPQLSLPRH